MLAVSSTPPFSVKPEEDKHFVVGAIDFGTTYSGYAFAFTRDPDSIHMMRKWEGGDPGVTNQKVVCMHTMLWGLYLCNNFNIIHIIVYSCFYMLMLHGYILTYPR